MTYHHEVVILLQLVCAGCGTTLVAGQIAHGIKVEPCSVCLARRSLESPERGGKNRSQLYDEAVETEARYPTEG